MLTPRLPYSYVTLLIIDTEGELCAYEQVVERDDEHRIYGIQTPPVSSCKNPGNPTGDFGGWYGSVNLTEVYEKRRLKVLFAKASLRTIKQSPQCRLQRRRGFCFAISALPELGAHIMLLLVQSQHQPSSCQPYIIVIYSACAGHCRVRIPLRSLSGQAQVLCHVQKRQPKTIPSCLACLLSAVPAGCFSTIQQPYN